MGARARGRPRSSRPRAARRSRAAQGTRGPYTAGPQPPSLPRTAPTKVPRRTSNASRTRPGRSHPQVGPPRLARGRARGAALHAPVGRVAQAQPEGPGAPHAQGDGVRGQRDHRDAAGGRGDRRRARELEDGPAPDAAPRCRRPEAARSAAAPPRCARCSPAGRPAGRRSARPCGAASVSYRCGRQLPVEDRVGGEVVLAEPAARQRHAAAREVEGLPVVGGRHHLHPVVGVGVRARGTRSPGTRSPRPGRATRRRCASRPRRAGPATAGSRRAGHGDAARPEAPGGQRQQEQRDAHQQQQADRVAAERRREGERHRAEDRVAHEERPHRALVGKARASAAGPRRRTPAMARASLGSNG